MLRVLAVAAIALTVGCEPPPGSVARRGPGGARDAGASSDLGPAVGSGFLRVTVLDDETGLPMPARVIVTAVLATAAVRFDVGSDGKHINGEFGVAIAPGVIGAPEGVLLVAGDGGFPIPAGTYDLFVTRGPEWERDLRRVTVADRATTSVTASLRHSVDTRGWLSADLHVHTARSFDSRIQVEDRVVTEVAAGVALIVTTDHNILTDLEPQIDAFGYHRIARAIVGDEFNFYEGHGGAYPMPYDPSDASGGGVVKMKLDWPVVRYAHSADMFAFLHSFPTRPAVTINHPRLLPDLGYFVNIGWAPPSVLPDAGLFDALELMSGYMGDHEHLAVLLRDWFFLLNSGHRVTALGNSDTHRLRDVKAGFPRTWLRLPSDDVTKITDGDLGDALKAGRAIASNGPFALLTVDGAPIGDLVGNGRGSVTIDALVDAPPWIDVDTVRLFVNGQLAQQFSVAAGLRPLYHARFVQKLPPGDAWVALQASGTRPLPEALIGEHGRGRVRPFVITNPVFVDGDGDQMWNPSLAEKDPGPIDLGLGVGLGAPRPEPATENGGPAPLDCEPPLWADPSFYGMP